MNGKHRQSIISTSITWPNGLTIGKQALRRVCSQVAWSFDVKLYWERLELVL